MKMVRLAARRLVVYSRAMPDIEIERALRGALFAWLDRLRSQTGGPVSYEALSNFEFGGKNVPLFSRPRGIHKPQVLGADGAALSVLTTAESPGRFRPYDDREAADTGYWIYKYQGDNPESHDNRAVRRAFENGLPLVYFIGVEKGIYEAFYPVFVKSDDPDRLSFHLEADSSDGLTPNAPLAIDVVAARRYATRAAKVRLHQSLFRSKVLTAYERRCSICRIRHLPLLDAAHITPDSSSHGTPDVPNGMALCKIHHAAFDAHLLGVSPDYRVRIKTALLDEVDGPMLQHGLKAMHETTISIPRRAVERPSRDRLAERFELFLRA